MIHLRYCCASAPSGQWAGENLSLHPQERMKSLGITYKSCSPNMLAESWAFWYCENLPEPLPEYLTLMEASTENLRSYGLTAEALAAIGEMPE